MIGFGNYNSKEWYFVFNDGERSVCKTNQRLLDFTENFMEDDATVTRIRVLYDEDTCLFQGIRYYNLNEIVLSAGNLWDDSSTSWKDYELEQGERVIGVVSGRRGEPFAYHYDIQFMIGHLE